jgi:hypothetical protein
MQIPRLPLHHSTTSDFEVLMTLGRQSPNRCHVIMVARWYSAATILPLVSSFTRFLRHFIMSKASSHGDEIWQVDYHTVQIG